jgi:tetratricopeptide (TPR) repeat protein
MKRAAAVIAVLCISLCGYGQDKAGTQNAPAGQTSGQTAGQTGQAAGQAAQPQGKRLPQAKTKPEFDAYNAAAAQTDPAALEKAADDFAAKFKDSELRVVLYKTAAERYQMANNADKMLEMARKALSFDPDDPEALVEVAHVLSQRTRDTDLDKDQKLAEAKKDAEHALETINTDIPTVGVDPQKLEQFKGYVRSEAYATLGTLASNANSWPEAEADLKKSIDAFPQEVDSVAVLMLAIALDKQDKTAEALKYANQAVDLTKDHPDSETAKAAQEEKDRLIKLSGGTAPGQAAPKN